MLMTHRESLLRLILFRIFQHSIQSVVSGEMSTGKIQEDMGIKILIFHIFFVIL